MLQAISYVLGTVLILLLIFFISTLFSKSKQISNELNKALALLKTIPFNEIVKRYGEIDQFFRQETTVLNHYWHEFTESLVNGKDRKGNDYVFNTIDADYFFSFENLISTPLNLEPRRHLSGGFTAIGIVFTFLGIFLGMGEASAQLQQLTGTNAEDASQIVTAAIQKLFLHISPAFLNSLIAVVCAVAYLIFEQFHINNLRTKVSELQFELNRLFPRRTPEFYLEKILEENTEQSSQLKVFSVDLANSIRSIMEKMNQDMQNSNKMLVGNISQSIVANMAPIAEMLKNAANKMKEDQNQANLESIENMARTFSGMMTDTTKSQMKDLGILLGNATKTLSTVNQQLSNTMNTTGQILSNTVVNVNRHAMEFEKSLEKMKTIITNLTPLIENIEKSLKPINETSQNMQKSSESVNKASENLYEALNINRTTVTELKQLTGNLAVMMENLSTHRAELSGFFDKVNDNLKRYYSNTTESLNKYNAEFDNHLSKVLSNVTGSLEPVEEFGIQMDELKSILNKFHNSIELLGRKIQQ